MDALKQLGKLIEIVETLRGENGCPWDRKQTPLSLSVYLKEEIYELVDAIESENADAVCEELGDVLFQILFIAQMFFEKDEFHIKDVASLIIEKMIRRHPHVFQDSPPLSVDEIKKRWHEIKMKEKNHVKASSLLDSIPQALPALMRAYRISERASRVGFDWENIAGVKEKAKEEWQELNEALKTQNRNEISLEFGDLLFTLVNFARFAGVHPEVSLSLSIKKFENRFKYMEKQILAKNQDIQQMSMAQLDSFWEEAKKKPIK